MSKSNRSSSAESAQTVTTDEEMIELSKVDLDATFTAGYTVVKLPTVSNDPVLQTRVRGRLPKSIGRLDDIRRKRANEAEYRKLIAEYIDSTSNSLAVLERQRTWTIRGLLWMQRQDMNSIDTERTVRFIDWCNSNFCFPRPECPWD